MPIVCALVPAYQVTVARLADPELRARPVIVVDRLERGRVLAVDDGALTLGARVGMTLVQAAACAREAAVAVRDPARDRALWERALDALDAASPLVEDGGDGVALLEMRGIAGDPARWLACVREALAGDPELAALPLHAALGPNPFVARVAARLGDGTVVATGAERAFVAGLPLGALELPPDILDRLALLGLRTLGDLAALPHGPFVRRFGPGAARWHACASGRDDAPLVPRARLVAIDRALYGEGTADREDQLVFALRTLATRVAEDATYLGKRCGALRLELECEDGSAHALTIPLAQPTAQASTMLDLIRARLEGFVLQSPVVGLRLRAERLEEGGAELSLFAGRDPDPELVGIALARLEAALGPGAARRARLADGGRYEARVAYSPFVATELARTPHATAVAPPPNTTKGTACYRVLVPRPVEVRVRGGRPALVGGRAVLECAGPWRVDEAWWGETLDGGRSPLVSDAYDVLLDDGALYRIVAEAGGWFVAGTYD